ncbi:MAG: MFS transporter, partial [Caulobacteraceae bacterium]
MSVAGRLEAMPYGRFHRRLLWMGGLAYSFDGFDVAMLGFVYPILARLWRLDAPLVGVIGSATFVGYFFGAAGAGLIADRIGRRRVMLAALAIYTAFSLLSALCGDWRGFMAARLLAGVGVGAQSAIVAPFLTEFVSSRYRGLFAGALASFFSFGFVGAALASTLVLPHHSGAWRWMLACT